MEENREYTPPVKSRGFNLSVVRERWKTFSPPMKISLLAVAAGTLLVIGTLIFYHAASPPMEVLFSELDLEQSIAVAARLEELNIPYQTGEEGASILVPRDQKDQLRLKLSPDIYAHGVGFALFENNNLITSDFERRAQWQIALEEELRRTITSIEAVEQARVHLVIPQDTPFIREKSNPSASIFLKLKPLASLKPIQVQGVLNLVAGSVEDLTPENITMVDSQGNLLFDPYAETDEHVASINVEKQLALTRKFEKEVEGRLKSILERVYGPGKSVAMVTADLDFDTRERTTVSYENPVNRSEHRVEERHEGTGGALGEVGESNIPGYVAPAAKGGDYSFEHLEETINYEIGETKDYLATAPGQIQRLSVAVMVDQETGNPEMAAQVTTMLISALGIDPERGDSISVQPIPFDTSIEKGWEEPEPESPKFAFDTKTIIAVGAAALLLLILIIVLVRKLHSAHRDPLMVPREAALLRVVEERASEIEETSNRVKVRELVEKEPDNVALLLKTWLAEE